MYKLKISKPQEIKKGHFYAVQRYILCGLFFKHWSNGDWKNTETQDIL